MMIHHVPEGYRLHQGINWNRGWESKIRVIIKIWRGYLYFRIRSKYVGGRRVIWDFHWDHSWLGLSNRIRFKFDDLSFQTPDGGMTIELLEDIISLQEGGILTRLDGSWRMEWPKK